MSLRPHAAECRDTEACDFQILTRFTQPHRLCSWSQSEICQNLDSNSAATLGPRAQVNYTRVRSRFDTFFAILLSKAPPISRNDLMPQKRLSYHKSCQQTSKN